MVQYSQLQQLVQSFLSFEKEIESEQKRQSFSHSPTRRNVIELDISGHAIGPPVPI